MATNELEILRAENAALKATQADEALIRPKMAAGLTREQALKSIENQKAFEAAQSALKAKKATARK